MRQLMPSTARRTQPRRSTWRHTAGIARTRHIVPLDPLGKRTDFRQFTRPMCIRGNSVSRNQFYELEEFVLHMSHAFHTSCPMFKMAGWHQLITLRHIEAMS